MSRGIVLWPDAEMARSIRAIWQSLEALGIGTQATFTHRLHQPHVSLVVAEGLPVEAALEAVGPLPSTPIPLRVEAAGVFPGGHLYLACVMSDELVEEQRRVLDVVLPLADAPWPYFGRGRWTPHLTSARSLTPAQLAVALPVVLDALPLAGQLDRGGVEDGSTGEHWPSPPAAP